MGGVDVQEYAGARGGWVCQISWSWSFRHMGVIWCRSWEPGLDTVGEQGVLLTTRHLSSPCFNLCKLDSSLRITFNSSWLLDVMLCYVMCLSLCTCTYACYMCVVPKKGQNRTSDSLVPELWTSSAPWKVSPVETGSTFNHQAISTPGLGVVLCCILCFNGVVCICSFSW